MATPWLDRQTESRCIKVSAIPAGKRNFLTSSVHADYAFGRHRVTSQSRHRVSSSRDKSKLKV
jgi:hypothetical protein